MRMTRHASSTPPCRRSCTSTRTAGRFNSSWRWSTRSSPSNISSRSLDEGSSTAWPCIGSFPTSWCRAAIRVVTVKATGFTMPATPAPARAASARQWSRRGQAKRGDRVGARLRLQREHRISRFARLPTPGPRLPTLRRHHVGGRLRRRLVEVDDDGVAIAADVVRDRLRQRDAHARRRRAERLGRLRPTTRRDRALRVGRNRVGDVGRRRRCGSRAARVSGSGRVVDVGHRLARLDDERRAFRVDARADRLQPDGGAVASAAPAALDERARGRDGQKQGKAPVTVIPWRPRAIAAFCELPAA